eukprot:12412239-Karenia_brevis.AAC.2
MLTCTTKCPSPKLKSLHVWSSPAAGGAAAGRHIKPYYPNPSKCRPVGTCTHTDTDTDRCRNVDRQRQRSYTEMQ